MPLWIEPSTASGLVRAPASKSAMQRAVACAGLADGRSVLTNPSFCDDSLAAMDVARKLGAAIERRTDSVVIFGGLRPVPEGIVASCGESGLCLRMYSAIAALLDVPVDLLAEGSLRNRPAAMVQEALARAGVSCRTRNGFPPVRVQGPVRGGAFRVDGSESSQFLTGLLIALAKAPLDSTVDVEGLASRGYIDLTLGIMGHFGARSERDARFRHFSIEGGSGYEAREYEVEGDWSAGAFLLAAGALAAGPGGLRVDGLSPESSQPDRAMLEALSLAGAESRVDQDCVTVRASGLNGFLFDARDCPDLFPPLVALASGCEGETRIKGVSRLRNKESDRAEALVTEFGRLGLPISIEADELVIRPAVGKDGRLRGGLIASHGDHRIAMAVAVAGLAAGGRVGIRGAACVAKSYPDFFKDLGLLGASISGTVD